MAYVIQDVLGNVLSSSNSAINNYNSTLNAMPTSLKSSTFENIKSWFNNALTGQRDYNRQKELMSLEMAYNSREAQKVRDFEERMANSSYQRVVNDLVKAGLNPGVAFSQGGASTPSVSAAHIGSHNAGVSGQQFTNLLTSGFGFFGSIINSAINAKGLEIKSDLNNKLYDLKLKNSNIRERDVNEWFRRKENAQRFYNSKESYSNGFNPDIYEILKDIKVAKRKWW